MEISILNEQTIQCILTEKEIEDFGMDKKALFQNDERVQEFFRRVMQQAQQETGFVKERGSVFVHAVFLPEDLLEITFSIDRRKAGRQEEQAVLHKTAGLSKDPDADMPVSEAADITTAVFKEKSFKNLVRFCRQIPKAPKTWMYKYQDHYFLLSEIHAFTMRQTASLFFLADEYVEGNCYTPGIAAYLKEHGTCMIAENAVEVLRKLS